MRPQILVTNDDGITAKGINCLVQAIKHLGDITVVAPDGPRSAQSNAITVHDPLRYWKQYEEPGVVAYRCNGTPSDCVTNDVIPLSMTSKVHGQETVTIY